jgi:hypothetical protein
MNDDLVIGLVSAAVPLLIIGFLALRRLPAVFAFFIAVVAVGLGYLTTTGTVQDIGGKVRAHIPAGILPASTAVKVDVAPPAKPVEAPAMAPAAPAPAPAPTPPAATPPAPAPSPSPAPATP